MINGILIVNKEKGYTSHDVVAKLRGICRQKKIGHTGTLDPDAEGVLPVCLGSATKLVDMLTDRDKEYEAEMLLGITTDTQDTSGTILRETKAESTEAEIQEVLLSFRGEYNQIPPMYSAIKVNGRKLYELAREGKEIERAARKVIINEIAINKIEIPRITLRVSCSKGTYIRTLCHDAGEKLGCGGAMSKLLRTRVGKYSLEDALTLAQIQELREMGRLESRVIPVENFFLEYRTAKVNMLGRKFIDNGNHLLSEHLEEPLNWDNGEKIRVYNSDGNFTAVYAFDQDSNALKVVKMFSV